MTVRIRHIGLCHSTDMPSHPRRTNEMVIPAELSSKPLHSTMFFRIASTVCLEYIYHHQSFHHRQRRHFLQGYNYSFWIEALLIIRSNNDKNNIFISKLFRFLWRKHPYGLLTTVQPNSQGSLIRPERPTPPPTRPIHFRVENFIVCFAFVFLFVRSFRSVCLFMFFRFISSSLSFLGSGFAVLATEYETSNILLCVYCVLLLLCY